MTMTLQEKLTGAWTLVSFVGKSLDGSPDVYPMGDSPQGLILYTPDGYMSAQIMLPDRDGKTEMFTEAGGNYLAYSGRYYTDERRQILQHHMFVSLYPDWLGQTQQRTVLFEDDLLKLRSPTPLRLNGKEIIPCLTCKRAEPRDA